MSSETTTCQSTGRSSDGVDTLADWLAECDSVVVGAGSGLSTSAGFTYDGPRFQENFADFIGKYGYGDMYRASFQRYGSLEEHWAFWSRMIAINRYDQGDNGTYAALLDLLRDRDYFVITTNVDHCFQRFGFDKSRLFYTQGDYGLWQCPKPCHHSTYDNEAAVRRMVEEQEDMRIPSELIPRCPICGRPMTMNLRVDDTFVQDFGWYEAAKRYDDFIESHSRSKVLYLELGVGFNTPGIIKYPFWNMTVRNRNARYACVNLGEAYFPEQLGDRALGLDMDIGEALRSLRKRSGIPAL